MTYTTRELEGVLDADLLAWRSWRRRTRLTIPEAAQLAGVDGHYLQKIETGKSAAGKQVRARLSDLMADWDESMRPVKPARARARARR